jgi:filamentous hemagglutinin family protein
MTQQKSQIPVKIAPHRSASLRRAVSIALHVMTPAALLMSAAPVTAGPQDGTVVRGAATIEAAAPHVVNINQTSNRAVIDWRTFSIGVDEQVNFNQPSSSAATLNRVLGGQRSVIEGALTADGQIFLMNSSGVLFTQTANVDVGGLVATTSTLRDDDFMAGDLKFVASGQPRGEVVNQGTITIRDRGMAALVAPSVRNDGVISARLGRVALGAGETFTLDLFGDQLINFALPVASEPGAGARALDQSGSLIADGGQVLLTTDAAAGIVGGVVNMSGIVQARSVGQNARGEIVLAGGDAAVSVSGRLDASGRGAREQGGSIDVFGQAVNLSSSAVLDATGRNGGGAVRVGGGFATDDTTPRAETTTIAQGATIDVSAIDAGSAGTVAVWGNESTHFAGTIKASGGANGGDGGFVEVSSKGLLQFLGDAVTDATSGRAGTVLLDPPSIRVEAVGSLDPTAAIVSAAALNGMLRRGTQVVLLADESITVNATIDGRNPNGSGPSGHVEMSAGSIILLRPVMTERNTITLNATSGNVTFGADAFVYVADSTAASRVGTSAITINAAGSVDAQNLISLGQISVTATTGSVALGGQFGLNNGGTASGVGSLTVNAAGNVDLHGARTSGALTVTSGGRIANTGNSIVAGGNVAVTAGTGGIGLGALSGNAPGLDVLGSSTVSLRTSGAVALASGIRTAGGDIKIGAAGARVASVTDGSTTGPAATGVLIAGGGGKVDIQAEGLVELRGVTAGGSINVDTNGRLTNEANAIVASGGGITLTAGNDANEGIDVRGPAGSPALQAANGAAIDIRTTREVTLGGVRTLGGTINVGSADARVNGLTMVDGAVLQTFDGAAPAGAISIFSGNGVDGHGTSSAPVGFVTNALNVDSTAGLVQLDGLYGVSGGADRIGSLTVNARGAGGNVVLRGAHTTGAIDISASGSISATEGTLISEGGGVELTAGTGITLDVPNNAAGIDARNGGNVRLRTPGGAVVLNSAIQAAGDLTIGENTVAGRVGSVTFTNTSLATPAVTLRAGSDVEVYANDAVALRGASAGGGVTIDTAGRLTNSANSIRAATAVDLAAGGGSDEGIELREIRAAGVLQPSVQVTGAGDVTLDTAGAVSIGGGIRTAGGNISIGATTPVASLTLLPGTTLQTFSGTNLAGAIDINATGAIAARSTSGEHIGLIARDITLESATGEISVDELLGLKNAGTFTGIGSFTASTGGAGAVNVREVEIKGGSGGIALTAGTGGIHFDAAGAASALTAGGTGSVTLRTPGVVDLQGGISTGTGSIDIGQAGNAVAAVTMAAGTQLRTLTGDVNMHIGSGPSTLGSIVGTRSGGDAATVTIRSDGTVAMLGAIGAPALAEGEDDSQPRLDTPSFVDIEASSIQFRGAETSGPNGVRLVVDAGGRVDLYGQIWSHGGGIVIGRPSAAASDATINLSHNLLTDGYSIDLNGNVVLFADIGRWGRDTRFGLEDALRSPNDENRFLTEVFRQRTRGIDEPGLSDFFSGAQYGHDPRELCRTPALCSDPQPGPGEPLPPPEDAPQSRVTDDDVMRFIGTNQNGNYNLEAYDSQGAVPGFRFSDTIAGTCTQWVCQYHPTQSGPIGGPQGLLAQAELRERRFQDLLGSLSVRIDTQAGGATTPDSNVNVSGSFGRYVAPALADRGSGAPIPDGYVNHELVINVGAGEFNVTGAFGDDEAASLRTGTAGANTVQEIDGHRRLDMTLGLPDLGLFDVVIESGTLNVPDDAATQFVNSISSVPGGVTVNAFDYQFPVAWTDKSNGALLPNQNPPGSGPFVPPVIGNPLDGGSSGINGSDPGAGTALGGNGSSSTSTGGGSLGTSVGGAGTDPSQSFGPIDFGLPSTSDSQQREDESDDEASEHDAPRTPAEQQDEDKCPRGASQEADLGVTRAVEGAAPDVFSKCPDG